MSRFRKLEDNTVENTAVGVQPVSNVEIINENTDNTDNTDNESSSIVEDTEKTEAITTDTEDPQKNEAVFHFSGIGDAKEHIFSFVPHTNKTTFCFQLTSIFDHKINIQ